MKTVYPFKGHETEGESCVFQDASAARVAGSLEALKLHRSCIESQ